MGTRHETRDVGARRETRDARRETRDARRETRDARRETRDARVGLAAWGVGAMQWVRSEAPEAIYAHKLASIPECLRVSLWVDAIGRSVGHVLRGTRDEGRLDDRHAECSVPCEAKPDYQPCELDVTTVLGEARANASAEQFMRINRGPRERRLSHVSQKPQGRKLTAACRKAQALGTRQRTTKKHRLLYRTNGQSIVARQSCAH